AGFFPTTLYWLLLIPYPAGAVAGWLALSLFIALYVAVWVWICTKIRPGTATGSEEKLAGDFMGSDWLARNVWAISCAVLWVALEMIRARFLTGFPWSPLGASQYRLTPLIQIASVTGVYGVSFLIVWFSVS